MMAYLCWLGCWQLYVGLDVGVDILANMIFRCWLGSWCFGIDVSILNVGSDLSVNAGRDVGLDFSII